MSTDRRKFIIQSALAAGSLSLPAKPFEQAAEKMNNGPKKEPFKISIFSKHFHWLDYEEMATTVKTLGFDGIDLTVRPLGHVLPEKVTEDLPKAVKAIRKAGLEVYMITTAITAASQPFTEEILKTASQLGVKYYRMGWFSYDKKLSIPANLKNYKQAFIQLEKLNRKYKIHGDYQNHAGEGFGAAVLDLWTTIEDINPEWLGCQYDIRHATVEGSNSWPIGLSLLRNHIKAINLKDFQWARKEGNWKEENVPLATGMVNFKKYFDLLKEYNFSGPVCLHYEYALGGAESGAKQLTVPKETVIAAMRRDLQTLKKMI
jgi:sugar phosphate isomerase/epimerase